MADTVELHRTGWMRFGGGPFFQPALAFLVVMGLLFGITQGEPGYFVLTAVTLVLWFFGATAYVRVDDTGIHRRCYRPGTDLWGDVEWVELYTMSLGTGQARRMIRIHRTHRRHYLAPAAGNGRHTEEFGRRLLEAARARGVRATGSGWGGFED